MIAIEKSEKKTLYINVFRDSETLYFGLELYESLDQAAVELGDTYHSYAFTLSISGIASTIINETKPNPSKPEPSTEIG